MATRPFPRSPIALALAIALMPALATAQDSNAEAATASPNSAPTSDPRHPKHDRSQIIDLNTVQVTATPLNDTADELSKPVDVLAGERLDEDRAASLGETISSIPGVQSSNFGPGVGRPIIRGMNGPRVAILNDGLVSQDVSTVSQDHSPAIEPFLADQIEVLKGPSTLL